MKGLQRKEIAEGLEDIAKYLGLNPEETVFIHSTNTAPDDQFKRIVGHYNVFDHSQPLCYLARSQRGKTAKAIILFNISNFLKYLDEIGIAPSENYINLNKQPSSLTTYSELSVQAKLLDDTDNSLKEVLKSLQGKTIVSSYLSQNDLQLKDKVKGSLIMEPKLQVPFNSKIKLREFSSKYKYNITLGIEVNSANEFASKISELKTIISQNKIDINKVKLWCKLESQSSGTGTTLLQGLTDETIEKLQASLIQFATTCKLYKDTTENKSIYNMEVFTPFVIEVDVESFNQNKIVANIGVEAVISESNVTIVGSVRQITSDGSHGDFGRYIGSRIDNVLETYQSVAEEAAIPVFDYFQSEGYKGFITLDVLVVEDGTKTLVGYSIDPNARFSGGTMLLSLVHYASKMTGKKFYGITYFLAVNKSNDRMETFKLHAGDNLFLGKQSNYKGILPLIINNLRGANQKDNIQVAVLSDNPDELDTILRKFKDNMMAADALHNFRTMENV